MALQFFTVHGKKFAARLQTPATAALWKGANQPGELHVGHYSVHTCSGNLLATNLPSLAACRNWVRKLHTHRPGYWQ